MKQRTSEVYLNGTVRPYTYSIITDTARNLLVYQINGRIDCTFSKRSSKEIKSGGGGGVAGWVETVTCCKFLPMKSEH